MTEPLTFGCHGVPMHGEPGRLGSAHARWNDYVGTAAADDADAILDTRSLYEIVGIDRDRWSIVGIDFSLADSADHVVVYAQDRTSSSTGESADDAHVQVTAFHLTPSQRLDEFLKEVFKRVSVRLLSVSLHHRELVVAEHVTLGAAAT
jgi:hypothetical protein